MNDTAPENEGWSQWWWLITIPAAVAATEVVMALGPRRWQRQKMFAMAKARAAQTGKPLLIIGAPGAGVVNRVLPDYEARDFECLDLDGCPGAGHELKGRAEDLLPSIATGSRVVFVSCVLEYVDDIDLVVKELRRITGPGNLFVAHVESWALAAIVYPGARRIIVSAPPESSTISWRPMPWQKKGR